VALQGTLRDFSLADIFQLIGLQKKTGVLTLKAGQEVVTVSFLEGNVVAADSLHRRLEDRLGTVLVKTGRITPGQLQEALRIQKQTLKRLGNVLVEQKFVTQEILREALKIQVSQMIYRLFRWRDGDYQFSQEAKLDYDRDYVVPLTAESVLMEGARIIDEWPIIEKRIGSLGGIYRRTAGAEAALSGTGKSSTVISPEEKSVLGLLDGSRSVQDIIESSSLSEFDTCRVLYELIGRQLAEKRGGEPAAPAPGRPAKQPAVETPSREEVVPVAGWILGIMVVISFLTATMNPLNGLALHPAKQPVLADFRQQVSRTRLERIHFAVQVYFLQNRGYPQDLNYLVVAGLLQPDDLRDPWDREYLYRTATWGYELQGLSPEGEADPALLIRPSSSH
jgi:uncharacterized protein DUF4388